MELGYDSESWRIGPYLCDPGDGDGPTVVVKDLFDVAGTTTTAGSRLVASQASAKVVDAQVVKRIRAAGGRIIAKANLVELAFGTHGVNPWFGTPINPRNPRLVPGGSSSGSAVAVASGSCDIGLGTDTGGSVRIPAACCGVFGLKTARGIVPSDGCWPLSWSLDTIGPLAANLSDLETACRMIGVQTARSQLAGLVQIPTGCDSFDHMVEKVIRSTGLPARVADVDLAAAWRLGGTVMGFEALQANGFLLSERHRLDPFVRKRLIAAQEISAREYLNALRYRGIARKDVSSMLNKNEVFVLPTLDTAVPTLEEALEVSLNRLTLPFNYLDFSVLAMPLNTDGANQASFNGIPFSIQLASPSRGVGLLLEAAEILVD